MSIRRLLSLPRLARNSLVSLLDQEARLTTHMPPQMAGLELRSIVWQRQHVHLSGQINFGAVKVGFQGRSSNATVSDQINLCLSRPEKSAGLILQHSTFQDPYFIPAPNAYTEALARFSAMPRAMGRAWRVREMILFFLRTGDQFAAAALRRQFGLTPETDTATAMPNTLFGSAKSLAQPSATIIIPIFNAAEDTAQLLGLLPETIPAETRVMLVDDGSDDPAISPLTAQFARDHKTTQIITHSKNLGFIAAVNSGISAAPSSDHIVLLNTDTLPPTNWLNRLLAPIAADASVASVTPMSNNAEILSVPHPGCIIDPTPDTVDSIDRVAESLLDRDIELPTGVGFCMALNRRFLDRLGGFDRAFGRGYGEEVDWCRRALEAGGRHIVATRLFVGHKGGASFGAAKVARIAAASRLIAERYPTYDGDVQDWIRAAPIAPERLALSLAWLGAESTDPVSIFLGHSLGGGAEAVLRSEVADLLSKGAKGCVILRVGGPRAWRIELHGQSFAHKGDVANEDLLLQLLAPLTNRRVVYSCGVGASDPAAVPRLLTTIAQEARLELRLHDFFPISPSWNLLDENGRFAGVPPAHTRDRAHQLPAFQGRAAVTLADWRALWNAVMDQADQITAFAPSGREFLSAAYPATAQKTVVRPHRLPKAMPDAIAKGGQSIGILGGIGRAKGGAVLEQLAKHTARRVVVIGEMDGQFRLAPPHVIHGQYTTTDITRLAKSYGIGLWLIPSVCPETFSFATHEALATGLPVASFNLGAQADTLQSAENGHVLDIDPNDITELSSQIETLWPR